MYNENGKYIGQCNLRFMKLKEKNVELSNFPKFSSINCKRSVFDTWFVFIKQCSNLESKYHY